MVTKESAGYAAEGLQALQGYRHRGGSMAHTVDAPGSQYWTRAQLLAHLVDEASGQTNFSFSKTSIACVCACVLRVLELVFCCVPFFLQLLVPASKESKVMPWPSAAYMSNLSAWTAATTESGIRSPPLVPGLSPSRHIRLPLFTYYHPQMMCIRGPPTSTAAR